MDPLPDADRPEGEPAEGVPVHWHPDVLLMRHPEWVATVDRFRTGARREISARDWERLTYREIEAVLVMRGAHQRAEIREIERRRRELTDGTGPSLAGQGTG